MITILRYREQKEEVFDVMGCDAKSNEAKSCGDADADVRGCRTEEKKEREKRRGQLILTRSGRSKGGRTDNGDEGELKTGRFDPHSGNWLLEGLYI